MTGPPNSPAITSITPAAARTSPPSRSSWRLFEREAPDAEHPPRPSRPLRGTSETLSSRRYKFLCARDYSAASSNAPHAEVSSLQGGASRHAATLLLALPNSIPISCPSQFGTDQIEPRSTAGWKGLALPNEERDEARGNSIVQR
ncbi:hypothetical protein RHECNPAF_4310078 [Rhizobium etli CNPAF512]|nr:hypothetical protein RHECNPAF_4310078 [Rhizobium etli CNPAF512]